jgi:hypothetical protein
MHFHANKETMLNIPRPLAGTSFLSKDPLDGVVGGAVGGRVLVLELVQD